LLTTTALHLRLRLPPLLLLQVRGGVPMSLLCNLSSNSAAAATH
jgi:hypothetical protein